MSDACAPTPTSRGETFQMSPRLSTFDWRETINQAGALFPPSTLIRFQGTKPRPINMLAELVSTAISCGRGSSTTPRARSKPTLVPRRCKRRAGRRIDQRSCTMPFESEPGTQGRPRQIATRCIIVRNPLLRRSWSGGKAHPDRPMAREANTLLGLRLQLTIRRGNVSFVSSRV